MDPLVFAAVLFAALCHAGWNAVLKTGIEPFTATVLVALGAGAVALPLVPFVGVPAAPAWPWLLTSVALHFGYYLGLIGAYRAGDMGQVYPLARGAAPLMTAIVATTWIGEPVGLLRWIGILTLIFGVLILSLRGGRGLAGVDRRAVGFALFTAVTICAYSLVDGLGGRIAQSPHVYAVWLFVLDGVMMLAVGLAMRGRLLALSVGTYWRAGLSGGALSFLAYWIVIWAMSVAPIALVAALRETSVLFGVAIAVIYLREPLRPSRLVAAALILAGLVLIRLA